jgi:hypothetical protein
MCRQLRCPPPIIERVALTEQHIAEFNLPTRPTKREGNRHAKNFEGESVELDALPPQALRDMVREVIERHITPSAVEVLRAAEDSERQALRMPAVGCCILARPTKQMGLYRQMIGRVLRPDDNKPDAIVLDHSGAVFRHGLPEDQVEWTLAVDRRAVSPAQQKRERGEAPKLRECPSCKTVMVAPPCGNCGWQPQPRARALDFEDGELGLVEGGRAHRGEMTSDQQLQFYRELRGFAHARNMKGADGWAFYKCKEKGFKPPWSWKENYSPLPPSPAVAAWGRSRLIAYAKRREATV